MDEAVSGVRSPGVMSIVFTSPLISHPPRGGPELRIENSIKALAQVTEVHLVPRVPVDAFGGQSAIDFFGGVCASITFAPSTSLPRTRRSLPWRLALAAARADARYLIHLADALGSRTVWCGYGNLSFRVMHDLKALRPDLRVVCDTDSVWSRFVLRELPYEKRRRQKLTIAARGLWKAGEERWWVDHCDATLAVSDVDAAFYRGIAREPARVRVFSNVIDLGDYRDSPPSPFPGPYLLVSGSFFRGGPMDVGAHWLISEVMPRVWAVRPDLVLVAAGRESVETLADVVGDRVRAIGSAPSLLPWLKNAAISVVPLLFESGTRFKILEAGACGVPVVSTTLGAEGLPLRDGHDVLLADDPDAFAAAILRVLATPELRATLVAGCRDIVRRGFSLDTLVLQAREILDGLG